MPGFLIKGSEQNGMSLRPLFGDWLRMHRFKVTEFFGLSPQNENPELLAVKDITLPDKEIADLHIQTPGTTYKFSKSAGYSDLVINFYATEYFLGDINSLHDRAHNLENGIGDFEQYKGIVRIRLYIDGTQSDYIEYTYKNAWVSNVIHGQVTYGSSEIKDIGVTIKFDFFEVFSSIIGDVVLADQQAIWRGNG